MTIIASKFVLEQLMNNSNDIRMHSPGGCVTTDAKTNVGIALERQAERFNLHVVQLRNFLWVPKTTPLGFKPRNSRITVYNATISYNAFDFRSFAITFIPATNFISELEQSRPLKNSKT